MDFIRNFPFFSIVLSMFAGIVSSILSGRNARRFCFFVLSVITAMSAAVLFYTVQTGEAFVYWMGHFPAPWGNEIRAGVLEAVMAVAFCVVMLLSLIGGMRHIDTEIAEQKKNLYFIMIDLLLSSLLALIYTNDLFTAYVFVEINTIAACGLIMIRQKGRTFVAAARYMIMSLLGSGMLLMGICFLYDLTGHLLMSNIKESVALLVESGTYEVPLCPHHWAHTLHAPRGVEVAAAHQRPGHRLYAMVVEAPSYDGQDRRRSRNRSCHRTPHPAAALQRSRRHPLPRDLRRCHPGEYRTICR